MEYNIKAKPTLYNGRLFRSRLEARWAAFFDLTGWTYQYEPSEMNGRNPDFMIVCSSGAYLSKHIIIEVKPSVFMTDEYMADAIKSYNSLSVHLLFLTDNPFYFLNNGGLVLGLGSQYFGKKNPLFRTPLTEFEMKCEDDFGSSEYAFDGMVTGNIERKLWISDFDSQLDLVTERWQSAANETMFLKPLIKNIRKIKKNGEGITLL